MSICKIIVIEDVQSQLDLFYSTISDLKELDSIEIELESARNVAEAFKKIDGTFDGAIIDMKLEKEEQGGLTIIQEIKNRFYRLPVIIHTATPDSVEIRGSVINVCKRSEIDIKDLILELYYLYKTGITQIMGGRGQINRALSEVFQNNILPRRSSWVNYAKNNQNTEKALLRYTLNHLLHNLDDKNETFFHDEVYLLSEELHTGSIVRRKDINTLFVILTPSCDMIKNQDGIRRTDTILLAEIEPFAFNENDSRDEKNRKESKRKNQTNYCHWLPPKEGLLDSGLINFRKLYHHDSDSFENNFVSKNLQISQPFVKDVISRFSSYYARQGQPQL